MIVTDRLQYEENVEMIPPESHDDEILKESLINPYNVVGSIGTDPWLNAVQTRRIDDKQRNDASFERIRARAIEFGAMYREQLKGRIEELHAAQKENRLAMANAWNKRELYRFETEAKNASLTYLLKRAKDAKVTAKDMEIKAADEAAKLEAKNKGKKK